MNHQKLTILSLLLLLIACGSHRKITSQIRELTLAQNHEEAIKLLKESDLATDERSRLLFTIELGLLEHYRGNYSGSIDVLTQSKALLEELYTTSASGKLSAALTNGNADTYYGEKYEASLVHFYLALNQYMLAVSEADPLVRRTYLQKARAEVLSWDTFLTELKTERLGVALFKEDLLAKTFGALIHEAQGTPADAQIALQLYKDASLVFFKNYNLFPTFNRSFKDFRDNFKTLATLERAQIEGQYVQETPHTRAFKDFVTTKNLTLTQRLRPSDLKTQIAALAPTEAVLKKLKARTGGQVSFLLQDGLVPEKVARKYEVPLILPAGHQSMAFGLGSTVTFELPELKASEVLDMARVQALDANGSVVAETELTIVSPIADLAEQAINEHSAAIAAATATRVIGKHVAAIVASNAAYQASRDRDPGLAFMVATLGHTAAIAAINESEKADLRYWGTLPATIRMADLTLPSGTYRFRAIYGLAGSPNYREVDLGEQTVRKDDLRFVMNGRKTPTSANRSVAGE